MRSLSETKPKRINSTIVAIDHYKCATAHIVHTFLLKLFYVSEVTVFEKVKFCLDGGCMHALSGSTNIT